MKLTLEGFTSIEQMKDFVSWYSNSGEQDFSTHLECMENPSAEAINLDHSKKTKETKR